MKTLLIILAIISVIAAAGPSGTYAGSKSTFGVKINAQMTVVSTSLINIDMSASDGTRVKCDNVAYSLSSSGKITFPNLGKSDDCVTKKLAQ